MGTNAYRNEFFATLSQIPPVFLSKNAKKMNYSKQLSDLQEFVKDTFPASIGKEKYLNTLIDLVSRYTEDSGTIIGYRDQLCKALPLLYQSMNFPYGTEASVLLPTEDDTNIKKKYRKILGQSEQHQKRKLCIDMIRNRMMSKIIRSDNKIQLPAGMDEEEFIKRIQQKINICYGIFDNSLLFFSYRPKSTTECRPAIARLVLSDYWLYPMLPAIFVLDAIQQAFFDRRLPKEDLLKVQTYSINKKDAIWRNYAVYSEGIHLSNMIKKVLEEELSVVYQSIKFPKSNSTYYIEDDFYFYRRENKLITKNIPFAVPICNTGKLATDIADFYELNSAQAVELITSMSEYIYRYDYGESNLRKQFGDYVCDTIRVFRKLSDPETYYHGSTMPQILSSVITSGSHKVFPFFTKWLGNLDNVNDKKTCSFVTRYFKFTDFTDEMLEIAAPIHPLWAGTRLHTKYYSCILEHLQEELSIYLQPKNLDKYFGFTLYSSSLVKNEKAIEREIKKAITVEHAVEFLRQFVNRKPKNRLDIGLQTKNFLEQLSCTTINQYTSLLPRKSDQMLWLYTIVLEISLNVLSHVCILILMACNMSTENPESTS